MPCCNSCTCCNRFKTEWKQPIFSLSEPDGNEIDVAKTFAPNPWIVTLPLRMFFLGVSCYVLFRDIEAYPDGNHWIYMGYLTHWTYIVSMVYQVGSILNVLSPLCEWSKSVVSQPKGEKGYAHPLVLLTWTAYVISINAGIIVALLYWGVIHDWNARIDFMGEFLNIMKHGGVFILVLMDGLVIGRTPLRIKMIFLMLIYTALYLTWTVIHAMLGVGNGDWDWENPEDDVDDDAIYPPINWTKRPKDTAIFCIVVCFVVVPLVFLLCWGLSLILPRRKRSVEEGTKEDTSLLGEGAAASYTV